MAGGAFNMCILLDVDSSDYGNNARFEFHVTKKSQVQVEWELNPRCMGEFDNSELSPTAKKRTNPNFQHQFRHRICIVEPVRFGTIRKVDQFL